MARLRWFEVDRTRLVLEHLRLRETFPGFRLIVVDADGQLGWEGDLTDMPPGVSAPPLTIRLRYSEGYPAEAPWIRPLAPEIPPEQWGHAWHRYSGGGICIVRPSQWEIAYTAADALAKAADWYFNYRAKVHGLADEMPDVGRVVLSGEGLAA